ncbi:hypothetical protein [Micromonospora sp. NPDC092111]
MKGRPNIVLVHGAWADGSHEQRRSPLWSYSGRGAARARGH